MAAKSKWGSGDAICPLILIFPGNYREPLFHELESALRNKGLSLRVYSSTNGFDSTVTPGSLSQIGGGVLPIIYMIGRRICIQRPPPLSTLRTPRSLIVEANPRNLTLWLLILFRRAIGLPIIGWGHLDGRVRRGINARIRRAMWRSFTGHLMYTNTDAERLRRIVGTNKPCHVSPNSIWSKRSLESLDIRNEHRPNIIYVGRLIPEKRVEWALAEYSLLKKQLPQVGKFHIVGDGASAEYLHEIAGRLGVNSDVVLHGAQTDMNYLHELYSTCFASVCAGYVGLSAVQSLLFGVPHFSLRGEPHSPELEALGVSGGRLVGRSRGDLSEGLRAQFIAQWGHDYDGTARHGRSLYTIERMVDGFLKFWAEMPACNRINSTRDTP